jgi:hypothetical protein
MRNADSIKLKTPYLKDVLTCMRASVFKFVKCCDATAIPGMVYSKQQMVICALMCRTDLCLKKHAILSCSKNPEECYCMVSISYNEFSLYLFTQFHHACYSIPNNKLNNLAPTLRTLHKLIREL